MPVQVRGRASGPELGSALGSRLGRENRPERAWRPRGPSDNRNAPGARGVSLTSHFYRRCLAAARGARRGPEGAALDQESHGAITEILTRLPDELRAAVVLRDVQNLNNLEAAEILEISVSALKARLHRGRVLLRKHLEGYLRS